MTDRRIRRTTSRTAAMTCVSRAASFLERDRHYHSGDHIAVKILPAFVRVIISFPFLKRFFMRRLAPHGIYEYVIARTKYIDAAFESALDERFEQVLLFGAGYDTRALRFGAAAQHTRIFELDAPHTQTAKIKQLRRRGLAVPPNVVFIAIDFDEEPLPGKLAEAGFEKDRRSLFILEGLLMYLEPESVRQTLQVISGHAGAGSRLVFDYVRASVLRNENALYGEGALVRTVSKAGEQWRFGIDPGEVASFAAAYGFDVTDHKCAPELEAAYFTDVRGRPAGRVNGTHCIVTATRTATTPSA